MSFFMVLIYFFLANSSLIVLVLGCPPTIFYFHFVPPTPLTISGSLTRNNSHRCSLSQAFVSWDDAEVGKLFYFHIEFTDKVSICHCLCPQNLSYSLSNHISKASILLYYVFGIPWWSVFHMIFLIKSISWYSAVPFFLPPCIFMCRIPPVVFFAMFSCLVGFSYSLRFIFYDDNCIW